MATDACEPVCAGDWRRTVSQLSRYLCLRRGVTHVPDSKLDLLLDSVVSILRALATMPSTPEVRDLAHRALDCERKVKTWVEHPPTPDERETMMKRVLGLHTALAKLA